MLKKLVMWAVVSVFTLGTIGMASAQFVRGTNSILDPVGDTGETENLELIGAGSGQWDSFANVVRGFINWTLGILALLALIILLRGGFQMVTAAGDEEKYKKWFTILKQAALWLAMIGVAWFIISLIFFVINIAGRGGENTSGSTAG